MNDMTPSEKLEFRNQIKACYNEVGEHIILFNYDTRQFGSGYEMFRKENEVQGTIEITDNLLDALTIYTMRA
jgi:hypothetical protein